MNESQPDQGSPWMQQWQKIARRVRVPLGFLTAVLYLFEWWRTPANSKTIAASLLLVLPGLWLRGYAAGYVKKNRELTQTGPYAFTRNPLYLGSILIAAGFAVALLNGIVAAALAFMFFVIYVPVIVSEERFLRAAFPGFDDYCRRVPRLLPRLTPARSGTPAGNFSLGLYLRHREYNAAIGAALLYLCLLFLRPVFGVLVHRLH